MEFHIARAARERYQVDQTLFNYVGNVIFGDVLAARKLAQRMSDVRAADTPSASEPVNAGALFAMGLIDELSHALVASYRDTVDPQLLPAALQWFSSTLSPADLDTLLRAFTTQFPTIAIFRGELTPDQWLAASTDGVPNREAAFEELVMLSLSNANPAYRPFHELFDDRDLAAQTLYRQATASLPDFFSTRPPLGPEGESLFDLLRAPMLAAPESLSAQLDFIRQRWLPYVGDELRQIMLATDVLREEEIAIWTRFHPAPATTHAGANQNTPRDWGMLGFEGDEFRGFDEYRGADESRRRALREAAARGLQEAPVDEYEAFSQDQAWMPTVVLLAKSTYVWLEQLSKQYGRHIHRLDQIPQEELHTLAGRGMNGLWLIGLWERSVASQTIKRMRGQADAVASAYSLRDYRIAEDLGGEPAYEVLRDRARAAGIRLASDMVPNHMGIDSTWVIEHPDWFVSRPEPPFPVYRFNGPDLSPDDRVEIRIEDHYFDQTDAAVVFELKDRRNHRTDYLYHGNDGTTFAWNDTAQLNYSRADVREHVIQTILQVARLFPIIRFDAAMTLAKKHVQRLWFPLPGEGRSIPSRNEDAMLQAEFDALMPNEFWREVVDRVAVEVPGTLLLAEAFWLLEGYFVRTLGMHRVYNSAFMNMLRDEENAKYRSYLKKTIEFDPDILKRYVNFMSNPDERTAIDQFGSGDKYFGCATLMATLPGLPMFGHGQVEAYTERYGMEYKRAKFDETPNQDLVARHQREIMPLLKNRSLFAESAFFRMYDFNTGGGVDENVFAFSNREGDRRAVILFNNSLNSTHGAIHWSVEQVDKGSGLLHGDTLGDALRLPWDDAALLRFRDSASNLEYLRWSRDLRESGLTMALRGYQYVVLLDWQELQSTAEQPWDRLAHALAGAGVPSLDEELSNLRLRPIHDALRHVLDRSVIDGVLAMLATAEPDPATPSKASPLGTQSGAIVPEPSSHESAGIAMVEAGTDRAAVPQTPQSQTPAVQSPGATSLAPSAKGVVTPPTATPSVLSRAVPPPPPGPFDWLLDRADTFYNALTALTPDPASTPARKPHRADLDTLLHGARSLPTLTLGVDTHGALPLGATAESQPATWAPILAWCLLHPVAGHFDSTQLRRGLASTFTALGFESEAAWKAAARVRLLLHPPTSSPKGFANLPDTFWNDPEVRWLTGVTETSGISFFHKESLEHLLAWLTLPTLIEHPDRTPEAAAQLAAAFTRARLAGYDLAHTLARVPTPNSVAATITPLTDSTVEEQADAAFQPPK